MNLYKYFLILFILNAYASENATIAQQRRLSTKRQQQRNQFIIYDPQTGRQLEPMQYLPVLLGNKRKPVQQASGNLIELPQLWTPCSCTEYVCICCLGIRFGMRFNQRVCVAVEYNAAQIALQVRINYNRRQIFSMGFSAANPLPICVPILLPLPLQTCLRFYDVRTFGGNVQVCISLVFNVLLNQLFEYYFDCIRFGINGIQFVKPLQQFPGAAAGGGGGVNVLTSFDEDGANDMMNGEGGGGEAAETQYEEVEERRQDIKLSEDYSGISVEGERRGDVVMIKKGKKRG